MKKIIFLLLFLFASLTTSADDSTAYTPPDPDMPLNCASPATQIRDVTINELYNGGGGAGNLEFFEIYFNETTNIADWRLYTNDNNTHQYTNLGIGLGDVTYSDGSTGLDNLATHTYPKGTFIVYKIDNIDPTNGEVFIANTTSALTSGASTVVDYFKYYQTSEQTYYTVTNSACSTALTGTDANAKDLSRLTDGSGNFYQYYPGTNTQIDYSTGSSNLDNLPANSTLRANVSIQVDFNQTQAYSGDLITLTLKITNPSTNSITVTDVNVTNLIPTGLSYVSNDGWTLLDPVLPSNPYGTVTATTPIFKWRLINGTKVLSFPTNSIAEINITLLVTATGGTIITDTATLTTKQTNQGTISSSDTLNVLSPSPIANYRFDNCLWTDTDTFTDTAGTYSGTAEALISTDGKICKAGDFTANSSTDVVRLPNTLLSGLTNFTYSVWIKASSTGGQQELLQGVRSSASIDEVEFYLDSNDKVRINIKDRGEDFGLTNNEITDNTWKHLVFTRNGGTMCLYINGTLKQCKNDFSIGALSIDSAGLVIGQEQDSTGGNFSNTQDYQGLMDEITVFNSALSSTEVQTLYNNQNNGKNYDGSNRTCPSCDAPMLNTCGTEDFSQYTATFPFTTNWEIIKKEHYTPNILNGKLMLTDLTGDIATGVTLNGSLPAANNYLEITFQSFAYGGNGADGITLTLSDAAITPVAGAFGGSLGYAQKTGINGFAGGWLGFGIDEYGNFSTCTEGRSGGETASDGSCSDLEGDSVSIRGSSTTGYPYIAGSTTLTPGIDQATEGPGHWYRMSIDTRNPNTLVKVERNTNSNGTGSYTPIINWTNATTSPANYRLSLTGSTGGSNNYHAADNFTIKALNCGTIQIISSSLTSRFDAWDIFRSINDRNISTKIVGKDFNLTVASLNSTNTALQDFNGTVCAQIVNKSGAIISAWSKPAVFFTDTASNIHTQTKPLEFNLTRAIGGSDYAGIKLHWKTNVNSTCPLTSEDNTSIASDRFAVRPDSFTLNAPNAIAGSYFDINFTAPNYSITLPTPSSEYNETVGSSFDINFAEHNTSCVQGSFTPAINSVWSFINGTKVLTTRYSEVGIVDINISDTSKACSDRYAKVDCDDASVTGFYNALTDLPIGTTQEQITIKPHHFDLNATLTNSNAGAFTYLSTDLNMSSKLDLNATAKNEQNITTLNYDKGCYAKTTTLTLTPSIPTNSLTKILYHENLSNADGNVSKSGPISIPFSETIFTQGSAPLTLLLNFDRSPSALINPFDFNITNAVLTDINGTTGTVTPTGTAKYLYGRARAYDIKTDQMSAPNPIELEVYSSSSTGYVSGMPQNILNWYRNLNHTTSTQGSILNGDDYGTTTKTGTSSTISVNPSSYTPLNGLHNIVMNNPDGISHAVVHLDIPSWLWYSTVNNYDFSSSTKCTQHPCFDYQFFGTPVNSNGVQSGTFQGSDFTLTPAKTIIKQGVKVFR